MPHEFESCVSNGGRVRTKKLGGGKYMHLCWDKSGKSHAGEVKTAETKAKTTKGAFIRAASK
jgi:hypothetical protein